MAASYTEVYSTAAYDGDHVPLGARAQHTYLLCATPRSGSNLLADALRSSGGLGVPLEYLDPHPKGVIATLMARWGVDGVAEYLDHLHAKRTDASGWLGVKVHWHQLLGFLRLVDKTPYDDGRARVLRQLLDRIFQDLRYVHLRREDHVAAAVSGHRAMKTGEFVRIGTGEARPDPVLDDDAVQDMVQRVHGLRRWDRRWTAFFEVAGITPFRLTYEELVVDVPGRVGQVRSWLGVAPGRPPEPGTQRQASSWSQEARERVEAALAAAAGS